MRCLSILASLVFLHRIVAAAAVESDYLASLSPSHPRLFAGASRFAQLETQPDPVSAQLRDLIRREADSRLAAAPRVYDYGIQNMANARAVQGDVLALAMAYRLFHDQRYAERAKAHLLQLSSLKNWGTGHFLDVGETALAAAVGYDWLYDTLSSAERETIAQAMVQRALLPSLEAVEGRDSWVNGNFNWNPVCHSGLMAAALAIAEREPALAQRILARAVRNLPIAGAAYSPDGATAEGPSYWSYGTHFYVLAIEMLRSALGRSYGLEAIPGILESAEFRQQLIGPSGQDFNYADYHLHAENSPVMLWYARETGRAELARDELRLLAQLHQGDSAAELNRLTPLELLWWSPSLPASAKRLVRLQWYARGHMPIGVMRSAYDDPLATYVAIKGGTPDYSHGHMDSGSFIMEAQGVRWAMDLGTESYDKMRAAKLNLWDYSQDSNRWTTFRAGPEAHNILRFNGARQRIAGYGQLAPLPAGEGAMGFVADLTSLYADAASRVTRTVLLYPDRSVSVTDQWQAGAAPVEVAFQWLTQARVSVRGARIELHQAGKTLQLDVTGQDAVIRVDDVSAPPGVQNSANPGLSRIVITRRTKAGEAGSLVVTATPVAITSDN